MVQTKRPQRPGRVRDGSGYRPPQLWGRLMPCVRMSEQPAPDFNRGNAQSSQNRVFTSVQRSKP